MPSHSPPSSRAVATGRLLRERRIPRNSYGSYIPSNDCQGNLISSRQGKADLNAMEECAWVYILMNKYNTTLYVGVTNNLSARLYEHFTKQNRGSFSAKYNLNKLVYYEAFESIIHAIEREKYVKGKITLVENSID
jgi:putative endonuclease